MMTDNADWTISPPDKREESSDTIIDQPGIRRKNTGPSSPKSRVNHRSRFRKKNKKELSQSLSSKNAQGIKGRTFRIPAGITILASLFFLMLALLFLRTWIYSLNQDVRYLQDELNTINSEIDSKNGRLISNADLKTIEKQARELGMSEARPSQYIYESAAKKQTVLTQSPVGLYDYLSFFVQIRKEGLWPIEH